MGKELLNVKSELEIQREANNRSPTTTMKNLVERLKNQLALKEKQQKVSMIISHFFCDCESREGKDAIINKLFDKVYYAKTDKTIL